MPPNTMARRVTIQFPPDRPYDFYATRVFWFAEALQSAIRQAGLGTLNDIDRAREVIWVDLSDNHNLGKAKSIIKKMLERFSLTDDATVSTSAAG